MSIGTAIQENEALCDVPEPQANVVAAVGSRMIWYLHVIARRGAN